MIADKPSDEINNLSDERKIKKYSVTRSLSDSDEVVLLIAFFRFVTDFIFTA